MTESQLEAALVRYARAKGILTYKFSSPAHRGVPDRIFIHQGRVLFLELKRPGNVPTKLQEHVMAEMCEAGANCLWTSDLDMAKTILDNLAHHGNIHTLRGPAAG